MDLTMLLERGGVQLTAQELAEVSERREAIGEELEEIQGKLSALQEQRKELQTELTQLTADLRKAVPIIRFAKDNLGLELPEELAELAVSPIKASVRGSATATPGKYTFIETGGDREYSMKGSLSRCLWRFSKDSGGSVEGGRLSSEEYQEAFDLPENPGEEVYIELPNGKEITVRRN